MANTNNSYNQQGQGSNSNDGRASDTGAQGKMGDNKGQQRGNREDDQGNMGSGADGRSQQGTNGNTGSGSSMD